MSTYGYSSPPPVKGPLATHPMSFAQAVGGTFKTIRRNLGAASVLTVLSALTTGVPSLFQFLTGANSTRSHATPLQMIAGLSTYPFTAIQLLLFGALIHTFAQSALNRNASLSASLRAGLQRVGWLILTTIIQGFFSVLVMLPGIIAVTVIAIGAKNNGLSPVGWVVATLVIIFSLTCAIVVFTRLMFCTTIVVMEEVGSIDALGRSWRLTKHRFFQLFLRNIAVGLLMMVVYGVFLIPTVVIALTTGNAVATWSAAIIGLVFVSLFTGPFVTYFPAVCYVDQRIREENFAPVLETAYAQAAGMPMPLQYGMPR